MPNLDSTFYVAWNNLLLMKHILINFDWIINNLLFHDLLKNYLNLLKGSLQMQLLTGVLKSSNINEVIRAVLKSSFFFYKKILQAQKKWKTSHKPKQTNKARIKTSKRVKVVCFAFLYFVYAKKKKREKSPHNVDVLNTDVPTTRLM